MQNTGKEDLQDSNVVQWEALKRLLRIKKKRICYFSRNSATSVRGLCWVLQLSPIYFKWMNCNTRNSLWTRVAHPSSNPGQSLYLVMFQLKEPLISWWKYYNIDISIGPCRCGALGTLHLHY